LRADDLLIFGPGLDGVLGESFPRDRFGQRIADAERGRGGGEVGVDCGEEGFGVAAFLVDAVGWEPGGEIAQEGRG
jgi:hypothetical protein